ncbi:class I SAM-dependent methyltransferase [Streptomyces sp. NPDC055036]
MPDETTARSAERIADLVTGHPWVARARVAADGGLLVTPAPDATAVSPELGPLLREHLDQWTEVYEWVYETGESRHTDDLDLSGWRASDTGKPLPRAHMVDWVDRTVDLVLAQQPRRVLELGCGTGLLAHRLHDRLEGYVGTDVARVAVDRLTAAALPRTEFVRAAAHEAGSAPVTEAAHRVFGPRVRPDCVLLNSVSQCFPNLAYLTAVLHGALAAVAEGGTVIIGDIRHSGLLDEHFGRLERYRDPEADNETIKVRTAVAIAADEELSFAPAAVARAALAQPRPVRMSVHARTMAADTELTRYRYDVVLRVGPLATGLDTGRPDRQSWERHGVGGLSTALRTALANRPAVLYSIPNALLVDSPGAVTPYALRRALGDTDAAILLDTSDPRRLAVAAPASTAPIAAEEIPPLGSGLDVHEPLPAFVRRRLPEVLRDHVRRGATGTVPPKITVTEDPA